MAICSQLVDRQVEEIEDLWQRAEDPLNEGSQNPGMTYEEGIIQTLSWLWEAGENPLPEE